jgi:hypothetical protein
MDGYFEGQVLYTTPESKYVSLALSMFETCRMTSLFYRNTLALTHGRFPQISMQFVLAKGLLRVKIWFS